MKKPLIIANWKMNPASHREAHKLLLDIERGLHLFKNPAAVVLAIPFVYLDSLKGYAIKTKLAAQDAFWEQKGAFTGEISPAMLKKAGVSFVLLGHSERKRHLGETKEQVANKVKAARKAGLKVVLCVKDAKELQALKKKGKISFDKNLIVTYEPPSAISTQEGRRVPPSKIAKEVAEIQKIAGAKIQVLYGGSVNAASVREIMHQGNVQGVLVGAASLKAKEFLALVKKVRMA